MKMPFANVRKNGSKVSDYILKWILVILVAFQVVGAIGAYKENRETEIREQAVEKYKAQVQAEIEAESANKTEILMTEAMKRKNEIEMIARLLEGIRKFNYDLRSLMTYGWCAYNRVDNANFADTLYEVLHQEGQWTGYSDNLPIVNDYYKIAEMIVDEVYNGSARPCSSDFVIAVLGKDGIYLKKTLDNKYSEQSWQWGW